MNDTNTKDYMIDVAQDTTYQIRVMIIRSRLQSGVQILRILLDSSLYMIQENTHTLMARVLCLIRQR